MLLKNFSSHESRVSWASIVFYKGKYYKKKIFLDLQTNLIIFNASFFSNPEIP